MGKARDTRKDVKKKSAKTIKEKKQAKREKRQAKEKDRGFPLDE